jgi:membrane-bound serine protease (ClpP class)
MLTLVAAPIPELRVNPWVAGGVALGFGGITAFLVRIAMRARRQKAKLGADALVGSEASAMEELAPEGHVLVAGEIWLAVASERVPAGAKLRVVGHEQYVLRVAPAESEASPRTAA